MTRGKLVLESVCLTSIIRVLTGARDTASLHRQLPWPSSDAEICRGLSNISRTFLKTDPAEMTAESAFPQPAAT